MTRDKSILVAGVAAAVLLLLPQTLFIVREGECAVRTTFGKPSVPAITEPGLYARWPWPVQAVDIFDARTHTLEGPLQQFYLADGKSVLVMLATGWRIADPMLFRERVGSPAQAARHLGGLLGNAQVAAFGRHSFASLVNTDPAALKIGQIEKEILDAVQAEARARYGVEIERVGVTRLNLPQAVVEKVYERMRSERAKAAARYRQEGEKESIRIRAEADSAREKTLAEASAKARRIQAEADAAAAEQYKVFAQDPELAMFLRKLEALEEALKSRTTVVLGTDTEPFDLLGPGGAPKPAAPAPAPAGGTK